MNTFTLSLHDANRTQQIQGVTSFVGEDASGSFGILPGHCRMTTCLIIGLARFRTEDAPWTYLALPGAVRYFNENTLTLSTRHYLLDNDYMRISQALQEEILAEEENLHTVKQSLHHMEEQLLKRLWDMGRMDIG